MAAYAAQFPTARLADSGAQTESYRGSCPSHGVVLWLVAKSWIEKSFFLLDVFLSISSGADKKLVFSDDLQETFLQSHPVIPRNFHPTF